MVGYLIDIQMNGYPTDVKVLYSQKQRRFYGRDRFLSFSNCLVAIQTLDSRVLAGAIRMLLVDKNHSVSVYETM